ncbi:hypothetical protein U2A4042590006 [Corynebacterium striatum]|nr:hypothetical protein U2A4042590006 [Corynebacterium striatum]
MFTPAFWTAAMNSRSGPWLCSGVGMAEISRAPLSSGASEAGARDADALDDAVFEDAELDAASEVAVAERSSGATLVSVGSSVLSTVAEPQAPSVSAAAIRAAHAAGTLMRMVTSSPLERCP